MLKSLKALSALLTYPTQELQQACGEISEALEKETAIPSSQRGQLHKLLIELASGDRIDLPAGTSHDALVGSQGVACLEAHLPGGSLVGPARRPAGAW